MTSAYNSILHSVMKIEQAELIKEPFPHLEIEDIFPEIFYKIMLARVPSIRHFTQENENVLRLDIINDPAGGGDWPTVFGSRAPEKEKNFWNQFQEVYFGEIFINTLLAKFDTYPDEDVFMCGRMCIDQLDSGLGPHTDRFDKVISLIFHLTTDENTPPGCETIILEPKDPNIEATDEHYSYDEFNEVKRISYKPNKLFAFKVCREVGGVNSFHGYHQDTDLNRHTIKMFIQRDIDPDEIREQVEATKQRSRRWREEIDR